MQRTLPIEDPSSSVRGILTDQILGQSSNYTHRVNANSIYSEVVDGITLTLVFDTDGVSERMYPADLSQQYFDHFAEPFLCVRLTSQRTG